MDSDSEYRFWGTWRAWQNNWRLQLLSIFSLAVAFVCLASALLVVTNLAQIRDRWSRAGRATVYLNDDASEDDVQALIKALRATPGVKAARHVGRREARSSVVDDGDESMSQLPVEAFPASVELSFDDTIDNNGLSMIALKLRALRSVETVETYQRWTERLSSLLRGGVTASLFLALIVFIAVVSVVASTMRLLLERRKLEIEVLRIVGATTRFVHRPFIVEGATQGACGAAAAVVILAVLYGIVRGRFDSQLGLLLGVQPTFLSWQTIAGMVCIGGCMGAVTAFISLRKAVTV